MSVIRRTKVLAKGEKLFMEEIIEKVKSVLLSIGLGLLICLGWIALVGWGLGTAFDNSSLYKLGFIGTIIEAIVMICALSIPIVIFLLIKGFKARCPRCKKIFSMKEVETRLVSRNPEYVTKINNTYSAYDGRVTHQSEQRVLGTRKTYKTLYVCKRCNAEKHKSYSVATDEVWKE